MAASARDPITCHVLDTTTGRPAVNITVKLSCVTVSTIEFICETNSDGRITNWRNEQGTTRYTATGEPSERHGSFVKLHGGVTATLQHMITEYAAAEATAACPAGSSLWKLEFDTGSYYGAANTFFPKVDLIFLVKEGEHFHVPLLLGPYSFTTYRGS
ncbi:hypothetical protein G7Y89_g9469 [Cudoniella acicularis]|uniref:5-hydroxyisourate hydrolase n=1 Tax=Cudoniella acicularis TaxID=354080 RepID=A0A8H4RIB0_9HELO|nr:hypothetical protein G7Y89_g9469 [Cudoniella acicularis]